MKPTVLPVLLALAAGCAARPQAPAKPAHTIPTLPAITVDGDAADWGGQGLVLSAWAHDAVPLVPAAQFAVTAHLAATEAGLAVLADLASDLPFAPVPAGKPLWEGDSIELFLRTGAGTTTATVQVLVAAVGEPQLQFVDQRGKDPAWKTLPPTATVARVPTARGVRIEALLPWSQLRLACGPVSFGMKASRGIPGLGRRQLSSNGGDGSIYLDLVPSAVASAPITSNATLICHNQTELAIATEPPLAWTLTRGATTLLSGVGEARLPMPAAGAEPVQLHANGQRLAQLTVPDVALALRRDLETAAYTPLWWLRDRDPAGLAQVARMRPYLPGILADGPLPQAHMPDQRLAAQAGITGLRTRWFAADGSPTSTAAQAGRYGAVVDVAFADGTSVACHHTAVRLPAQADAASLLSSIAGPAGDPAAIALQADLGRRTLAWLGTQPDAPVFLAAQLEAAADGQPARPQTRDQAWWHRVRTGLGTATTYDWHRLLPPGYEADTTTRWPAVIYLHGSGGRLPRDYPPRAQRTADRDLIGWAKDRGLPLAVYALLTDRAWEPPAVLDAIDRIIASDRIDPNRIILMGFSMGGIGTWNCAVDAPQRFAAAVPIGGRGYRADDVATIAGRLPVWAFNGDADLTTTLADAQRVVEALRAAGGDVRLTVLPGVDHGGSQNGTFATPGLWDWVLAQRRRP